MNGNADATSSSRHRRHKKLTSGQHDSLMSLVSTIVPSLPPPPTPPPSQACGDASATRTSEAGGVGRVNAKGITGRGQHGSNDDNDHRRPSKEAVERYWTYDLTSDVTFVSILTDTITNKIDVTESTTFLLLLALLSTTWGTWLLLPTFVARSPKLWFTPFCQWDDRRHREEALLVWKDSPMWQLRKAFVGVRKLIGLIAFSYVTEIEPSSSSCPPQGIGSSGEEGGKEKERRNPFWDVMGYDGPRLHDGSAAEKKMGDDDSSRSGRGVTVKEYHGDAGGPFDFRQDGLLDASDLANGDVLEFDCVIVGSGCGGSVAAATLAAAGYTVAILEKGRYRHRTDMKQLELEALDELYEGSGLVSTTDGNMLVLAGSTVGGGSTINWSCCIPTPNAVREEWAEKFGLDQFHPDSKEYSESMDEVYRRIGARPPTEHSVPNMGLLRACENLGYPCSETLQNLIDTSLERSGAEFIGCGDRYGNKQDMMQTYLQDAVRKGCKIIDGCRVVKVLHETTNDENRTGSRRATGVVACIGAGRGGVDVTIRARRCVVAAAGALNTPCLMLRSGFGNRHIGKHLHLHPVTASFGRMDHPVRIWRGAPMTTCCNAFTSGPEGDHHGARVECPSVHSGIIAAASPWYSGMAFKEFLSKARDGNFLIVLQRDVGEGRVSIAKDGFSPQVDYTLDERDARSMVEALLGTLKLHIAAGASFVQTGHNDDAGFHIDAMPDDRETMPRQRVESAETQSYLDQVGSRKLDLLKCGLFSAHQMSSCRMGSSPGDSACDKNGELWECDDVFVFDTSAFPSASGSNPMSTVLALSNMLSRRLALRLRYEDSKLQNEVDRAVARKLLDDRNATRPAAVPVRTGLSLRGFVVLAGAAAIGGYCFWLYVG